MRGDTEDEGIEHDAEEDELEADEDEVDGVDGEGRRKQSTGSSRLSKSGVARELVTHCRLVLPNSPVSPTHLHTPLLQEWDGPFV